MARTHVLQRTLDSQSILSVAHAKTQTFATRLSCDPASCDVDGPKLPLLVGWLRAQHSLLLVLNNGVKGWWCRNSCRAKANAQATAEL